MEPIKSEERSSLNDSQKRRLLVSCQYIDKLLAEIESILTASASGSPFPKYGGELSPTQRKVTQDYIARLRAQLVRVLEGQGVALPSAHIDAIRAIRTMLDFVDIAAEELKPKYMRGYGEIPPSLIPELNGIAGELRGLVKKFDAYLAQGLGQDLQGRLARLDQTDDEIGLLKAIEQIVLEHGLVEYRPAPELIVDRLEETRFEIALFGRVSTGKSSLLNGILQANVLPVGVNPITAIPTRIVYGPAPRLTVWFAEKKAEQYAIERLAEFATEQQNSANAKHVTRLIIELPSPRLPQRVVFVDTPGLGSLASAGAAETMAYLPQCDLGVVLVDASSTLTQEDLSTIRALYEAAIPAFVLLSKADLLAPADRARAASYVAEHIKSQLGLALTVRPVSAVSGHADLLHQWFEEEIWPLYGRHQQLAKQSVRRKIGALREAVEAALRVRLDRTDRQPQGERYDPKEAEARLRRTTGYFEEVRLTCERLVDEIPWLSDLALARAAAQIAERAAGERDQDSPLTAEVVAILTSVAAEKARELSETLERLPRHLAESLDRAAQALDVQGAPGAEELASAVREMPRLDLGGIHLDLRFKFLSAFGKGIARRRVEQRLRDQVGPTVADSFSSYGRLLRAWAMNALEEMQRRFNAHADAYRAQLGRLTSGAGTSVQETDAIRRDLKRLAQWGGRGEGRKQTIYENIGTGG
jgi:GTP-binding protein EngB required for normal cell division/ABC-type transporter Mla subunit MlaD